MIEAMYFREDHRCFAKDSVIAFRPGVNLIVGDQGCGKSTLLKQMMEFGNKRTRESCAVYFAWSGPKGRIGFLDFEHDNPRTQPGFGMGLGYDDVFQIQSMFASHGQVVQSLAGVLDKVETNVYMLDEPDGSLSVRSCVALAKAMRDGVGDHGQVIAAVHSETVIAAFDEVLSIEHGAWMSSAEFLRRHHEEPAPEAPAGKKVGECQPRMIRALRPKTKE